jgi:hypothetical protein
MLRFGFGSPCGRVVFHIRLKDFSTIRAKFNDVAVLPHSKWDAELTVPSNDSLTGVYHGPIDQSSVTDALSDVAILTLTHDVTPSRTSVQSCPSTTAASP